MAGQTSPHPISWKANPCPKSPTESGPATSPFIPTSGGWLYLASSSTSTPAASWAGALADNLRSGLVLDALRHALQSRSHVAGAIFHSRSRQPILQHRLSRRAGPGRHPAEHVRASQPVSQRMDRILHRHPQTRNAQGGCFHCVADAKIEIFNYIEAYYNTRRKHSSLGYLSPSQFESSTHQLN